MRTSISGLTLLVMIVASALLAPGPTFAASEPPTQEESLQTYRAISDAVTHWENEVRAKDPDYPIKEAIVMRIS